MQDSPSIVEQISNDALKYIQAACNGSGLKGSEVLHVLEVNWLPV